MNLQEACEIAEKLLEDDAETNFPKLNMPQFAAINQILLELQADKKYVMKEQK